MWTRHPVRRQLEAERLAERDDAALGDVVRQVAAVARAAAGRDPVREQHDVAAAGAAQVGNRGLGAVERRVEVHGQGAVPGRGVEGVEGDPIEPRRGEDDRGQAPQGLGGRIDERATRRRLREIGLEHHGPASGGADRGGGGVGLGARLAVGDRDVVAVRGQGARDRAADPPGAGDEGGAGPIHAETYTPVTRNGGPYFRAMRTDGSARRRFLGQTAGVGLAVAAILTDDAMARARAAVDRAGDRDPEDVARDEEFWREIQLGFTLDRSIINLNNGGVCPARASSTKPSSAIWTSRTSRPCTTCGRCSSRTSEAVRRQLAASVGCDAEELAITRNASEALQIAQLGLDLAPGDEVVTTNQDYGRMLDTWEQRVRATGSC